MFKVLENGTPAAYPYFDVDPSWNKCQFKTLEEAQDYVRKWLGYYVGPDFKIGVDEIHTYNGHDEIVIVDVQDDYNTLNEFFETLSNLTDPAEVKEYLSNKLEYAWACLKSLQ